MSNQQPLHRARYDSTGNIILESDDSMPIHSREVRTTKEIPSLSSRAHRNNKPLWSITEKKHEAPVKPEMHHEKDKTVGVHSMQKKKSSVFKKAAEESKEQLKDVHHDISTSLHKVRKQLEKIPTRSRGIMRAFFAAARSPVMFPGSKRKKPRSKLSLFVIDTVKFGGTFATIFITLFSIINYESFYQIAVAELALGSDLQTREALQEMAQGSSTSVVENAASTFAKQGSLLAYLPEVGPYEDRVVIPKIGKNLPIVRPSMDGLMKEDWKQFESDLQTALHDGVVHYPGSARPGQAGNFFLTAHSSYYFWSDSQYKDAFARLHELNIGDTYFVYYGGDKHVYRVIEKKEVKPSNVSVLDQPTDRRLSTLMTCTPIGTTLRRLIIVAEEIDPTNGVALVVGEKSEKIDTTHFKNIEALPI